MKINVRKPVQVKKKKITVQEKLTKTKMKLNCRDSNAVYVEHKFVAERSKLGFI